ncbi:uncharacterized protein LOC122268023 [Penaeus japonicus]|uniref:uncharacterized protein LOC122268023 n=1 Tax=Penaeus japonicus TaxID=27405 RepID=UPI001C7102C6|nr:uncharacterized protein LOC122268023 [Penaeus japonicus]
MLPDNFLPHQELTQRLDPKFVVQTFIIDTSLFLPCAPHALQPIRRPHPTGSPVLAQRSSPTYKQPGMPFDFAYAVRDDYSGNDYAHRDPAASTSPPGSYRVALFRDQGRIIALTRPVATTTVCQRHLRGKARYPALPLPAHAPPTPAQLPTPTPPTP